MWKVKTKEQWNVTLLTRNPPIHPRDYCGDPGSSHFRAKYCIKWYQYHDINGWVIK